MTDITENIILTPEMEQAVALVADQDNKEPLYITGKAGSGKSTLLRHIVESIKDRRFVVTASTGIAAINVGGVTLHSFFRIPIGIQNPKGKLQNFLNKSRIALLQRLDVLIIDEVSMVRPDMLDHVDRKLRFYRHSPEPFGGVKVVMFGDLHQLPPVVKDEEREILSNFYAGEYFYYANVFHKSGFNVVELTKIFRQSDPHFIDTLNHVRNYSLTVDDEDTLSEMRDKKKAADYTGGALHICSYKLDVQRINAEMLGKPTNTFEAQITGEFNAKNAPCDMTLKLRPGARVMTLINNTEQGFCNGSLGEVVMISDKGITLELDNGSTVCVERHEWENIEYELKGDEIIATKKGSCLQFPVTLAWAMTIHKSQGLTFDNVVIHARNCFAPGQIYVALSRCRTLEGIATDGFITKRHIKVDPDIINFERAYQHNGHKFHINMLINTDSQ